MKIVTVRGYIDIQDTTKDELIDCYETLSECYDFLKKQSYEQSNQMLDLKMNIMHLNKLLSMAES